MPTTTNYIWDEDNLLAEADGTNTINTVYTNEPQQYGNLVSTRISGETSYHHFDAIGSTRQLTNAVGHVTDTAIYDAWGNVVNRSGATGVMLLWIGEIGYYLDSETFLFSIRVRPDGPNIARWTAVDPLTIEEWQAPYVYSANSPVRFTDPSGLQPQAPVAPPPTTPSFAICGAWTPPVGKPTGKYCSWLAWINGYCCTANQIASAAACCARDGETLVRVSCDNKTRLNIVVCEKHPCEMLSCVMMGDGCAVGNCKGRCACLRKFTNTCPPKLRACICVPRELVD
jgi:RHS repeat-associated protein